ncbi:MAG: hypothetical protein L0287_13705 [Anaerolineae bacterium]|nr:hypothetical protein [Anaerolineae bacterium]
MVKLALGVSHAGHQTIGCVGELQGFAIRVGDARKIAVGVEREGGALAERRDDGGRDAVSVAFDSIEQFINIINTSQIAKVIKNISSHQMQWLFNYFLFLEHTSSASSLLYLSNLI